MLSVIIISISYGTDTYAVRHFMHVYHILSPLSLKRAQSFRFNFVQLKAIQRQLFLNNFICTYHIDFANIENCNCTSNGRGTIEIDLVIHVETNLLCWNHSMVWSKWEIFRLYFALRSFLCVFEMSCLFVRACYKITPLIDCQIIVLTAAKWMYHSVGLAS